MSQKINEEIIAIDDIKNAGNDILSDIDQIEESFDEDRLVAEILNVPRELSSDKLLSLVAEKKKNSDNYWDSANEKQYTQCTMLNDTRHSNLKNCYMMKDMQASELPLIGSWVAVVATGLIPNRGSIFFNFIGRFPFGCESLETISINRMDNFSVLQNRLIKFYHNKSKQYRTTTFVPNQMVAVFVSKDRMWYRGYVVNLEKKKKSVVTYQVILIDYGYSIVSSSVNLFSLDVIFTELEPQAVNFCLTSLQIPLHQSTSQIRNSLVESFKCIANNKLMIGYIDQIVDDMVFVTLYTQNCKGQKQCVNFYLKNKLTSINY